MYPDKKLRTIRETTIRNELEALHKESRVIIDKIMQLEKELVVLTKINELEE